jgi:hypothetical protein
MAEVIDNTFQAVFIDCEPAAPTEEKRRGKPVFCVDCALWVGRCLKGRLGRIAWSEICQEFSPKKENRQMKDWFGEFSAIHASDLR